MGDRSVFDKLTLTDTAHAVKIPVRGTALWGLQWVQHSGGGTAAIAFYASALRQDDERLADTDPTNIYWSLTPIAFETLPAGVPGSGYVPIAESAVNTMLVVFTVTGTAQLSLFSFLNEAQK